MHASFGHRHRRLLLGLAPALTAALALPLAAAPASAWTTDWSGINMGMRGGYDVLADHKHERIAFDTNLDGKFGDTVRTAAGADAFSPGFCAQAARTPSAADGCSGDKNNVEWGVHLGYDRQVGGGFVLGALGEIGGGHAVDKVSAFSTTPAYYVMQREQHFTWGARVRLGYAIGESRRTLVYVTGGGVHSKLLKDFRSSNTANSFAYRNFNWAWGWRAGAGIERRVAPRLSIGMLYLFTSIDDDKGIVHAGPGTSPATNPFRLVNPAGTDLQRTAKWFNSGSVSLTATAHF